MRYATSHATHRASIAARVTRLADLLELWEECDADQVLPLTQRRGLQPPASGRTAVAVLHRALLAELHHVDAPPRPAPSVEHVA
jgi:hypothetical protein